MDDGIQPVVLFDFDGVPFKGDSLTAPMRYRCRRRWRCAVPASSPLLAAARSAVLVNPHACAPLAAAPKAALVVEWRSVRHRFRVPAQSKTL